jgi:hypothetical protein
MSMELLAAARKIREGLDEAIAALEKRIGEPEGKVGSKAEAKPLGELSFKELRALAAERGVSDKGGRDDLIERLSGSGGEKEEESPAPKKAAEKAAKAPGGAMKKPAAKAPDEDGPDEGDGDESGGEADSPIHAQVMDAVAGMEDGEILDMLSEIGAKPKAPKGKKLTRAALIAAAVQAVEDGKLELEDDDSAGDSDDDDGDEDESDGDGAQARQAAIDEFKADAEAQFESGELTRKDMEAWLDEYDKTDKKAKKAAFQFKGKRDEAVFAAYLEKSLLYIDDEGGMAEDEEPYSVDGEAFCCGHKCGQGDDGDYICGVCGGEYTADDGEEDKQF